MLTVADLIAQPTQRRDLAFLSACQTAASGARHLDEAIHLAAAMQFLGYRHVIATLWTIADLPSPKVADTCYTALTVDGQPDPGRKRRSPSPGRPLPSPGGSGKPAALGALRLFRQLTTALCVPDLA